MNRSQFSPRKGTVVRRKNLADYVILVSVVVRRGFDSASSFVRHLGLAIGIGRGETATTKAKGSRQHG